MNALHFVEAGPASVYCEQHGNKLKIITATDGSQSGVCVFPDGSSCDARAYFREASSATLILWDGIGWTIEKLVLQIHLHARQVILLPTVEK